MNDFINLIGICENCDSEIDLSKVLIQDSKKTTEKVKQAFLEPFKELLLDSIDFNDKTLKKANISGKSVNLGFLKEKLALYNQDFPIYDELIFLGDPIDYISINSDCINFIEVKSGNSKLNTSQKDIKSIIENTDIEILRINSL